MVPNRCTKTKLCRHYPNCHRGDLCNFAHGEEELGQDQKGLDVDVEAAGTAPGNIVVADARYTGTVKPFGTGATFTFISSEEIIEQFGKDIFCTIRELEHLAPGQEVSFRVELHKGRAQAFDIKHLDDKGRGPGLEYKKTKLCMFWSNGRACPNGAKCTFAHGEDDLGTDRPPDAPVVKPKTTKPLVKCDSVCFEYQEGICNRGDKCRFQHDASAPCSDFQRGKCVRENCRFAHVHDSKKGEVGVAQKQEPQPGLQKGSKKGEEFHKGFRKGDGAAKGVKKGGIKGGFAWKGDFPWGADFARGIWW